MGMCFGVRDALEAIRSIEDPSDVSIYGELVHNPKVLEEIANRGISQIGERERSELPQTPRVLITAHGLSNRARQELAAAGKQLIDTTCPLVRRAHTAAVGLERAGYFVVVIGKPDHVEVVGLTGDLKRFAVVASRADVRCFDEPRIGIVAQTTTPPRYADEIVGAIRDANLCAEIRFVNTICRPTRERQEATEQLLREVEALVVVGGRHSNNTRQLVELARSRGVAVQHVKDAEDLDREALRKFSAVGLTAGTSTLEETVAQVQAVLEAMPAR